MVASNGGKVQFVKATVPSDRYEADRFVEVDMAAKAVVSSDGGKADPFIHAHLAVSSSKGKVDRSLEFNEVAHAKGDDSTASAPQDSTTSRNLATTEHVQGRVASIDKTFFSFDDEPIPFDDIIEAQDDPIQALVALGFGPHLFE